MRKVFLKESVFIIGFCILCSCGNESSNQEEKFTGQSQMEGTTSAIEKQNPDVKKDSIDVDPVLDEFGCYLQDLIVNGERNELDQYIISNKLTWEEAARRAETSSALSHFADYGDYNFTSNGAIIVEADVNGDGILDMIEYLSDIGFMGQNSLTIYEGKEDGTYEVMLYEPFFSERLSYYDKISVARYQQNIFLILEYGLPSKIMNGQRTTQMCAYQVKDEKLKAIIKLEYKYTDMIPEVVECKSGLEEKSEQLCENGTELFLSSYTDELYKGSAEEIVGKEEKDFMLLDEKLRQEQLKNIEKYQPLVGDVQIYYYPANPTTSNAVAYRSDLNNDGVKEVYSKTTSFLGLKVGTGTGSYSTVLKTGEDKFDKEYGLVYTLLVNGKRSEIEKISGLNLWGTEYIPQIFWVDTVENENIVYINYINEDFYDNKIEAYLFKGDSYERVMAIKFTPRIECNLSIDQKVNDSAPLRYTIHLVGNISNQYLEIYGLDDESKQQRINKNLNEMVEEKVNLIMNPKEGEPETEDASLLSIIYSANDKELIIQLIVVYSYVGFEKSYSKEFLIKINLLNGEVEDVVI